MGVSVRVRVGVIVGVRVGAGMPVESGRGRVGDGVIVGVSVAVGVGRGVGVGAILATAQFVVKKSITIAPPSAMEESRILIVEVVGDFIIAQKFCGGANYFGGHFMIRIGKQGQLRVHSQDA